MPKGVKRKGLYGKKFGRLTVISHQPIIVVHKTKNKAFNLRYWEVKCSCGNEKLVRQDCLVLGKTKSCGCYQRERTAKANTKYGHFAKQFKGTKVAYYAWANMKQNCDNPKVKNYKNYGQKNITYCDRYKTYQGFIDDLDINGRETKCSLKRHRSQEGFFCGRCKQCRKLKRKRNVYAIKA